MFYLFTFFTAITTGQSVVALTNKGPEPVVFIIGGLILLILVVTIAGRRRRRRRRN